uniref:Uncharacterized protein n=1 Tax=Arundo donax TaxID=35708 RepID=A0A0A9GD66_ARUDO
MALRALGRSSVMTATPLGKTRPFTNSSAAAAAMATKRRTMRWGKMLGLGARVLEAAKEEMRKDVVEMAAGGWMRERRARIVMLR